MEKERFEIDKTGILLQYHGNEKNVVLPDKVSEIGLHAFYYCKQMESITFSENLKRIDRFAFLHCSSQLQIQAATANETNVHRGHLLCYNKLRLKFRR